ncbi:hypothetical protein TNCV_4175831 [Trichonephila clavipes]|nr:hypothetical protein TNCV_4175831 [Trichonephila clavipes]
MNNIFQIDRCSYYIIVNKVLVDIRFERKFLTRKYNPAVYLQVDDHVHPGNCPAAVSSEKKKTRPSSYGVLPSPAELGYERTDVVFFLHFLMNGAVI